MAINGVGDVIALVQITTQAAKTLHAAAHAPYEIRRFIQETDRYQSCVGIAASRLRRHGAILKDHADVKSNIQGMLEQCAETTRKLRKIATRYEHIVKRKGVATGADAAWLQWIEAFKTVYQTIEWTTKGVVVEGLRAELSRHIQMLTWLENGLLSEQVGQLSVQVSNMHDMLAFAMSSPSPTPLSSPFGPSPNPTSPSITARGSGSQVNSPELPSTTQAQPMAPLWLPGPTFDIDDYDFGQDIEDQLVLPESFVGVTPGDQYRHVKLASIKEQKEFVENLTAHTSSTEIRVESVHFVWRKPGASDGVLIEASDSGRVLLVKNGAAVEDIWTVNDKRTIRFRQREPHLRLLVPTWEYIIPYSINGDELTAVVEQGEGLTFFTIEEGQRRDHPRIPTTWVQYKFKSVPDCELFQQVVYGSTLRLVVPVTEICRPHRGRDDDRLVGFENVRVWEMQSEMRFMVHLIQEKGKRRKKYLEFNLCQDSIKIESKGTGRKSTLLLTGIHAPIDEMEFQRRASTSTLNSDSTLGPTKSLTRRFSWDRSLPYLDKAEIYFRQQEDRDSLLHLALSCRPNRKKSG
ncbi:hypothetical protein AYO20_04478 [Fonsecaea nubica]|uniref:Uncharacterized protein n=1 Tax=Fonsecaea nubica TaxID=856822 RepID=A0A178D2B8_9EURO|nr:hypothetical protein AYO20_04478 [Fonsecaea nubica]OAL36320.1 hypothetical protein AYO20_04478 [Fonsecaea nubica]